MKTLKSLLLTLLISLPAWGVSREGQVWAQFLSQGRIDTSTRLWLEAQPRYGLSTGKFTTVLLRPAIGWQIAPEFSFWTGYAWTPSLNPVSRDEHRAWFQGILALTPMGLNLTHRLRLEGRFMEGVAATAIRLRYFLRVSVPLALEQRLNAVLYDELFFSLNNAAPLVASGLDQNRLFLGLNYRFSSELALDLGYLWNVIPRRDSPSTRIHHTVMLTLYHSFTLESSEND